MGNKIKKIVYILILVFWSGFVSVGLVHLIGYNEIFNFFTIKTLEISTYNVEITKKERKKGKTIKIHYSYFINNEKYSKFITIGEAPFRKFKILPNKKLEINYNTTFPQLSYIKSVRQQQHVHKGIIVISLAFMVFISISYVVWPKILKKVENWARSRGLRE